MIFSAASQPSLGLFSPSDTLVIDIPPTESEHTEFHSPARPGEQGGRARHPPPGDLPPTSGHTQAGWDQKRFSFPMERTGIWGGGEN